MTLVISVLAKFAALVTFAVIVALFIGAVYETDQMKRIELILWTIALSQAAR